MYSVDFVAYPHPFFSSFLALFLSLLLSSIFYPPIHPSIHPSPSIHSCMLNRTHTCTVWLRIHICVCFLGGQFGIAQPEFLHSSWGRLLLPSSPSFSCLRLRTPKLFHFHFSTPISVFCSVMFGQLWGGTLWALCLWHLQETRHHTKLSIPFAFHFYPLSLLQWSTTLGVGIVIQMYMLGLSFISLHFDWL